MLSKILLRVQIAVYLENFDVHKTFDRLGITEELELP